MPIKLKQLDGDLKSPNKSSNFNNGDGKSKQPPLESKPCRYFASDKGAKLAKVAKVQVDACLGVPARQVGAVLDLWQQGASEERLPLEVIYSQMTW